MVGFGTLSRGSLHGGLKLGSLLCPANFYPHLPFLPRDCARCPITRQSQQKFRKELNFLRELEDNSDPEFQKNNSGKQQHITNLEEARKSRGRQHSTFIINNARAETG